MNTAPSGVEVAAQTLRLIRWMRDQVEGSHAVYDKILLVLEAQYIAAFSGGVE